MIIKLFNSSKLCFIVQLSKDNLEDEQRAKYDSKPLKVKFNTTPTPKNLLKKPVEL